MSDVMMGVLQRQIESLTRQVEQLGPENERVRRLLTEFDKRHDEDSAEISELRRRLGGGCDANNGGNHSVMSQGRYKFCGKCGESLRGVRFCHEPRQ